MKIADILPKTLLGQLGCLSVILLLTGLPGYGSEGSFSYDSQGKRDPFIPLVGKGIRILMPEDPKSIKNVILEGIIFDPSGGSLAIVNSEIVQEGQLIQGFILSQIKKKAIILKKDEENFTIHLIKEE